MSYQYHTRDEKKKNLLETHHRSVMDTASL
jgi:hypothetical protein